MEQGKPIHLLSLTQGGCGHFGGVKSSADKSLLTTNLLHCIKQTFASEGEKPEVTIYLSVISF